MHTWIQNRWSRSLALLLFCWDKSPRFCINIPWSKLCKRTMRIFPISNKSILILTIMLWSYLAGQMVFRPSLARSLLKLLASGGRQGGRIFIRDFFQGFSEILFLKLFWRIFSSITHSSVPGWYTRRSSFWQWRGRRRKIFLQSFEQ